MAVASSPEITSEELEAVVRRALDAPGALLGAWAATPLSHRVINGITGGLWRIGGTAGVAGEVRRWSVVLKIIGGGTSDPPSPFAPSAEPGHWNYWRREPLLYASGLLDGLPTGLRTLRSFGATQPAPDVIWLWLEDIGGTTAAGWPIGRFARAARLLGRWQGAYAAGMRPLPAASWLSTDWLRAWVPQSGAATDPATDPANWRDPLLAPAPPGLPAAVAALWHERDALLAAVEALPACLCHRDLWAYNLLTPSDADEAEEIVLIDWSQAGVGVLGEDPANLVFDSAWMYAVPAADLPVLSRLVLDEYCAGLRDAGWAGDEGAVRASYAAIAALRFGLLARWVLALAAESGARATGAGESRLAAR